MAMPQIVLDTEDATPLYRQLERALASAIGDGTLAPGDRLPSERTLAEQLGVSRTTTVMAYRELEARGLVRGSTGRGTFVCAGGQAAGVAPFAWQGKVSAAARRTSDPTLRSLVQGHDAELISFSGGTPALDLFPVPVFQQHLHRVFARDVQSALGLGPTEGQPALRLELAARHGVRPEQVIVLAGSQQGLDLVARCLVEPNDVVLVDRPTYLGAIQVFRAAGARLVGWDARRADLDELEDLLQRYRPKLLYTNPTFHNPTGRTLNLETRRDLLTLAARYRLAVLEDDPYSALYLSQRPPPALHSLDDQELVIYQSTFSKTLAAGLRVSWMVAPEAMVEQVALVRQRADLFGSGAYQLVLAAMLADGSFERHLAALRREHRQRLEAMTAALRRELPPGLVTWQKVDGGLYLWLQAQRHLDARVLTQQAVALGVEIISGEHFYADGGGRQDFRLCFTRNPAPVIAAGVARLAAAVQAAESLGSRVVASVPLP
ncbi:MAG: PLP-dependent aminotransferase family protein [Thermomicrobiales bacterium]|nr:PLP-dependent aminotransferase family protein [Thermomicrobiales bacterium]